MRLYLVRHGEAKSKNVDANQHLTQKGVRGVEKVAAFLKPLKLRVGAVWHSGKARAAQTASILCKALEVAGDVVERQNLAPNDPIEPVKRELIRTGEDLMIVGHLPFLGRLASALVAGNESADVVAFQPGGLVCIERSDDGGWRVRWMIVPELVP